MIKNCKNSDNRNLQVSQEDWVNEGGGGGGGGGGLGEWMLKHFLKILEIKYEFAKYEKDGIGRFLNNIPLQNLF